MITCGLSSCSDVVLGTLSESVFLNGCVIFVYLELAIVVSCDTDSCPVGTCTNGYQRHMCTDKLKYAKKSPLSMGVLTLAKITLHAKSESFRTISLYVGAVSCLELKHDEFEGMTVYMGYISSQTYIEWRKTTNKTKT